MTARRTKKDHIKARSQRGNKKRSNSGLSVVRAETVDLMHYDTKLIIKDLTRTLIASIVVIGVLVALYFKL